MINITLYMLDFQRILCIFVMSAYLNIHLYRHMLFQVLFGMFVMSKKLQRNSRPFVMSDLSYACSCVWKCERPPHPTCGGLSWTWRKSLNARYVSMNSFIGSSFLTIPVRPNSSREYFNCLHIW